MSAVILQSNKILLGKRLNEPATGKWSISGGTVEIGESLEHAVMREIKEETGIDFLNPQLFDAIDIIDRDAEGKIIYHFVIVDYVVTVLGVCEPVAASDTVELHWMSLNKVEDYDLT